MSGIFTEGIFSFQGPLLEFVGDFWHMITSEKSSVIVMLCNFNEGKHEKCCFYLPKEKREVGNFGEFKVTVKEFKPDPFDSIKHTVLDVKWDDKAAVINHLANFNWPDHTAPLNAAPTIGMFKLSRSLSKGAPITVHCSAGIGRSATFVVHAHFSALVEQIPNTIITIVSDPQYVDILQQLITHHRRYEKKPVLQWWM
ncbi:hypothetical protein Y032_0018g3709 [Ancylostoma ceylanicum]|uniref:Protein-tyrosine phosphatase n=1 Tax=Ancylostoma ceylanicum TaxID=53326 RepID=A0A016V3U6_9BILA|nr:hypothetical protein Y032_0018g3709 [Ancylostoma ceylanicum]